MSKQKQSRFSPRVIRFSCSRAETTPGDYFLLAFSVVNGLTISKGGSYRHLSQWDLKYDRLDNHLDVIILIHFRGGLAIFIALLMDCCCS